MSMDKVLGSVFGAAASATKMLTAPGIILTPEEIKSRIILAALVAIPGAIMGYIVTLLCKWAHQKIKCGINTIKANKQNEQKNRTRNIIFSLLVVILFSALPFSCSLDPDRNQTNITNIHVDSKTQSNLRVAIIAGHGSIINNKYQTFGKQSPEWENGLKIYEGFSTHQLAYDLASSLMDKDIDVDIITPNGTDISLYERVKRANSLFLFDNRTVVISIHHNAQPNNGKSDYCDNEGYYGWYSNLTGGATGTEVYTSNGQTESDILAEIIIRELKSHLPKMNFRTDLSDKDQDKEANFYVLRKTYSPSVLIEWMFMTNYEDCIIINDPNSRRAFVEAVTCAIVEYNETRKTAA